MSNSHNLVTKYALVAMNIPFRNELPDLLGISDPDQVSEERVDEAIMRNMTSIKARRLHMADNFAERVSEILAKVQLTRDQPTKALSNDDDDLPDAFHENELLQAIEGKAPLAPAAVISHVQDNEEDLPELIAKISQEQRSVLTQVQTYLEQVDQFDHDHHQWRRRKEAVEVFATMEVLSEPTPPTPPRLIILGPGGTGKSFLIRVLLLVIRKWSRIRSDVRPSPQQGVVLAAPTGIAAFNVGGSTIHSAFNLKVEKTGYNKHERLGGLHLSTFKENSKMCKRSLSTRLAWWGPGSFRRYTND